MSRKAIKRSFRKSAEYSAALVFGVLFLVSSMYSLPNFSATKSGNASNDTKNLKTTNNSRLDSSYKKYCNPGDHDDDCSYVSINTNSLLDLPVNKNFYNIYLNNVYKKTLQSHLSIRAPPINA